MELPFYSDCVSWPSENEDALDTIRRNGDSCSFTEFKSNVKKDQLREMIKTFGYDKSFTIQKDWAVKFCKYSKDVYFFVHSGIEYVFAEGTTIDKIQKEYEEKEALSSLSDILYHRTSLHNAADIMKQDRFRLTPNVGTQSDQLADKYYFLSTSRTPTANFWGQVTLVLDGRELNKKYKGGPVDYWGAMDRDEAEDRLVSNDHYIDNAKKYITEVHCLIKPDMSRHNHKIRSFILEVKKANIPLFLYDNEKAYLLLTKQKAKDINSFDFSGPEPDHYYHFPRRMSGLKELIYLTNKERLTKEGKYWLRFRKDELERQISNELHNFKTEESIHNIIEFMKKHKLKNGNELADFLYDKCQS